MGMRGTQWRHDHRLVVRDRSTAYERRPAGDYATLMPFTNVYGNGGLLGGTHTGGTYTVASGATT